MADSIYLSRADRARIDLYERFQRLFDGAHDKVFTEDLKKLNEEDKKRYVVANLGALISKVSADYLFGEELVFSSEDEKAMAQIDELRTRSGLDSLLWETALENSYLGDAYLKVRLDPEMGGAVIEAVHPSRVRILTAPGNVRRITAFVIQWEVTINGTKYVRREIRERNRIVQELWSLNGEELSVKMDLGILGPDAPAEETLTGVDGFLMVHIPNFRGSSKELLGRSDYADLTSLFGAMNNRLTRDQHILDKHADPKLAVPPGVLDEKGKVRRAKFEMFEVSMSQTSGLVKPEYITWDGNLDGSEKFTDRLLKHIFLLAEVSPDIFGLSENGGPDSGRALRLRLMRTLAKIKRKKRYYRSSLDTLIYEAGELERINGFGPGFEKVTYEFQDGLPTDYREEAEIRNIDRQAGVVSVEQGVRERNPEWDDEQIAEEVERIEKEGALTVPVGGMFGDGSTGGGNGNGGA